MKKYLKALLALGLVAGVSTALVGCSWEEEPEQEEIEPVPEDDNIEDDEIETED
jgi:hypothetical protein